MSSDNSSSGSTTDRMSASAPPQATKATATAKETGGSEVDYLKHQADLAKAAMQNTLRRMGRDVATGVDPRAWMQDYPWWTLLGAAAGGFAVGAAVTPPKIDEQTRREQERQRRWQSARWRAMVNAVARAAAQTNGEPEVDVKVDGHDKPHSRSFLSSFVKPAFDMAKPLIFSAISAYAGAQRSAAPDPSAPHPYASQQLPSE